jgi:DNA-binding NtrC family response regulator
MLSYAKVLMICSDEREKRTLEGVLNDHVILRTVADLGELQSVLEGGSYDALLCGWSFHRGTWNDALKQVQERCPDLPVIIFSGVGGEREWLQVLEAGGFDLLVAPFIRRTVLPVLEQAVYSHDARRLHGVIETEPIAKAN